MQKVYTVAFFSTSLRVKILIRHLGGNHLSKPEHKENTYGNFNLPKALKPFMKSQTYYQAPHAKAVA